MYISKIMLVLASLSISTSTTSAASGNNTLTRVKRLDPGTITAIAGVVTSVVGSTVASVQRSIAVDYKRHFIMTVSNHLKWSLDDPIGLKWWGHISDPPSRVRPCYVEAVAGHKNPFTASGTSGMIVYSIKHLKLKVAVFWSVPWGNGECNELTLSIYNNTKLPFDETTKEWHFNQHHVYNTAHYKSNTTEYFSNFWSNCDDTREICVTHKGIKLCGTMSTTSGALINIYIEPLNAKYLPTKEQCSIGSNKNP